MTNREPHNGGQIRVITTADPAANTEIAATAVPTGVRWRLLSFTVSMAQGVTQTPRPALLIRNASAVTLALVPLSADVAASTTVQCTWARGVQAVANNVDTGSMAAPAPDMDLTAGFDILTSTQGIGAGSDYGAATLVVEEFVDT